MTTQNHAPSQQRVGLEVSRYPLFDRGHRFLLRELLTRFRERCQPFDFGQSDEIFPAGQRRYRELFE